MRAVQILTIKRLRLAIVFLPVRVLSLARRTGEVDKKQRRTSPMNAKTHAEGDLQTQLESLLRTVWECEREWAIDDRIDLAVRLEAVRRPL